MSESALKRWEHDPEGAYDLIRDVNQLTMTALSEMRILLLELRPSALTQINIEQLFEQYLQPIQLRRDFELKLDINGTPKLPPGVQLALYRITQEALNNIDKHAQANNVEVIATGSDKHIELVISDDGGGFDIESIASTNMGLRIMRERASEIDATISIDSKPKHGTQIKVIWEKEDQDV